VDPLDLDHAADVRVDVQGAVGVDLGPIDRLQGRGPAGEAGIVARKAAVVGSGLAVHQVDLETENGLNPADRELEVRAEPGPGVPLLVAVPSEVAVVEVPAHRRDLVEKPADGYRRGRSLSECRRRNDQGSEHCKDGNTSKSSHSLSCGQSWRGSARFSAHLTPTERTTRGKDES